MTERLPEATVFKDVSEQDYLNQLIRVLRNLSDEIDTLNLKVGVLPLQETDFKQQFLLMGG